MKLFNHKNSKHYKYAKFEGDTETMERGNLDCFGSRFELLTDDEVVFKMLQNNSSHIVGQLDDIRKHPK